MHLGKKLKRGKKAQVTAFVIIAIVIVVAISLAFYFSYYKKPIQMSEEKIIEIKDNIKDCLKIKFDEALLFIGKQGGYYILPNTSIDFFGEKTAYYLKNNKNLVPTKKELREEIKSYLEYNVEDCFNLPYDIETKDCDVTVLVAENATRTLFNCHVKIKEQEEVIEIKNFEIEEKVDLLSLLKMSNEVISEYRTSPSGYLCVDCIDNIALKYGYNLTILPVTSEVYEKEPHVWFFINSSKKLNGKWFIWRFVSEVI